MKDEIKEKIKAYYIGNDIDKVLDYITNLQEENEFLKLNNPEQNLEHFRIIKENKRKIDNLRAENERLKEDYENEKYYVDKYTCQLTNEYKNTEYQCEEKEKYKSRCEKAIEILKDTSVDMPETLLIETIDYARHILNGGGEE